MRTWRGLITEWGCEGPVSGDGHVEEFLGRYINRVEKMEKDGEGDGEGCRGYPGKETT